MAGQTQMDDSAGSDPGLGGRLARIRERFEAAWDRAENGGTLPDLDAYIDRLPAEEAPAARLLLESIDRARRARVLPSGSAFDSPTIDTSAAIKPPGATDTAEAETVADPEPSPTVEPDVTVAATGAFESGLARADEPPETLADTADFGGTVNLATTIAVSSAWKPSRRGGAIPSQVVPGYDVLGELGRGGMGVVYKALQVRANRLVALKMVLAGAHASDDQLARFATEAQAVAQLDHVGIVRIYDVGEHDGLPYFSLEFVEGGSLAQDIGGKPQAPRRAASIVAELAEAMAVAHAKNILHRDLKPANVLLTPDGRPKITDFGLAKKLEGDSAQTRSGAVMGTPSYMAPEQAFGLTREIGPPADQYALGAILYEMLTGRPPFQGATALETLELARNQEPVPPRRLQPRVPVDLETIALKALQKEIPKRYAETADLARDLRHYLDGEPIKARPVSFPERSWRWCRRNPRLASLNAAIAGLVLLGLIGSTTAAIALGQQRGKLRDQNFALKIAEADTRHALKVSRENEKAANDARKAASVAERDARKEARAALIAQVREREAKNVALKKEDEANQAIKSAFEQNKAALESIRYMSLVANQSLLGIPGTREARAEILKVAGKSLVANMAALETLAPIANDRVAREDALRTMAGIHQRAGHLAVEVLRIDEASKQYEAMLRDLETCAEEFPDSPKTLRNIAAGSNTVGDFLLHHIGDAPRARGLYERALEARRNWLESSLRRMKEDPGNAQWPMDAKAAEDGIAVNLGLLSNVWFELGDPIKARDYAMEEAESRARYEPSPTDALKARVEHAAMFKRLGDIEVRLGDRRAGMEDYKKHLSLMEQVETDFANDAAVRRNLLHARLTMGHAALTLDRDPAAALERYKPVLGEFRTMLNADPTNAELQGEVSISEYYCGTACLRMGDKQKAEEHFRESLRLRRPIAEAAKADIDQIPFLLALARCGEVAEAEPLADAMASKPTTDNRTTFHVACVYALCAGAVAKGRPVGSLSADDAKAYNRLIGRSYELIRRNLARGWRNPVELEVEPDLDPLRDDPEFPRLLDEARKAAAAPR